MYRFYLIFSAHIITSPVARNSLYFSATGDASLQLLLLKFHTRSSALHLEKFAVLISNNRQIVILYFFTSG